MGPEGQAALAQAALEEYRLGTFEHWPEDVAYLRSLTPDVRVAQAILKQTDGFNEADAEQLAAAWPAGPGLARAHFGVLRAAAIAWDQTPVERLVTRGLEYLLEIPLDALLELVSLVYWGTPNPPPWGHVVCAVWRNKWLDANYPL